LFLKSGKKIIIYNSFISKEYIFISLLTSVHKFVNELLDKSAYSDKETNN